MFPALFENGPRLSSIQDVKDLLFRSVQYRLDGLSEQDRELISVSLWEWMNEFVVRLRFQANQHFERVTGNTHVLHSISQLIRTIDTDNPLGEVTNGSIAEYAEAKWLSYMGVR